MADISDVTAIIAQMADNAVYPNGSSAPSVTGRQVTIFEGWPQEQSLDPAIAAGQSQISIFPMRTSGGGTVFQVLSEDYLIVPPVHGMTISSIANGAVSVMGSPSAGEYLTVIADGRHAYSRFGPDLPTILNLIATDASADYQGVSTFPIDGTNFPVWGGATGGGIRFPTTRLNAHIGSPAIKGRVTHRQRASILVTIWSPNNADRNALSIAVDVALKAVNRLVFPDTSQGLLVAERFEQSDTIEPASIYRRDLYYSCEYATLEQYQAFEVTSFSQTISAGAETTYVNG